MNTTVNSYKASVRLADIVPGNNPRKEFGDIGALAAAIEATGGQPLNPIVVVRDGNRYRIVDGERRYRALTKLRGADGTTDVLVFPDFDAAQEAVAMLATDDKMQLSEVERAQGFQTMMVLGIDSQTIAKAMRRKASDIDHARAVAKMAPAQATLDQMIAASEFESEEDQKAVLAAKPEKWAAKAKAIRAQRLAEHNAQELYKRIEGLGLEVFDEQPEGYSSIMWADTADAMERLAAEHEGEELAAWPVSWHYGYWYLGHKAEAKAETPEERAGRELRERRRAAYGSLRDRLIKEVATCDIFPEVQAVAGRMRDTDRYDYKRDRLKEWLKSLGVSDRIVGEHINEPTAMWETLLEMISGNLDWAEWVTTWLPAVLSDEGCFDMTDEDRWLLEQAQAEVARQEAKDADE